VGLVRIGRMGAGSLGSRGAYRVAAENVQILHERGPRPASQLPVTVKPASAGRSPLTAERVRYFLQPYKTREFFWGVVAVATLVAVGVGAAASPEWRSPLYTVVGLTGLLAGVIDEQLNRFLRRRHLRERRLAPDAAEFVRYHDAVVAREKAAADQRDAEEAEARRNRDREAARARAVRRKKQSAARRRRKTADMSGIGITSTGGHLKRHSRTYCATAVGMPRDEGLRRRWGGYLLVCGEDSSHRPVQGTWEINRACPRARVVRNAHAPRRYGSMAGQHLQFSSGSATIRGSKADPSPDHRRNLAPPRAHVSSTLLTMDGW
jgi:hypothetical protein